MMNSSRVSMHKETSCIENLFLHVNTESLLLLVVPVFFLLDLFS